MRILGKVSKMEEFWEYKLPTCSGGPALKFRGPIHHQAQKIHNVSMNLVDKKSNKSELSPVEPASFIPQEELQKLIYAEVKNRVSEILNWAKRITETATNITHNLS